MNKTKYINDIFGTNSVLGYANSYNGEKNMILDVVSDDHERELYFLKEIN